MSLLNISKQSVLYRLLAITVSNTFLQILGFAYRIILSRAAGAETLGIYQLLLPFYSLLSSLSLSGLCVAVSKISASRAAQGDYQAARSAVYSARKIFFSSVLFLAAITFVFRGFITKTFLGNEKTLISILPLFVCLSLTGVENLYKNYFYGVGKVAPQITSELSEQVFRAVAVVILLSEFKPEKPEAGAMLIIVGMIISELSSDLILSLFFSPEKKRRGKVKRSDVRLSEILSVSIPVSGASAANNLLSALNTVLLPRRLVASGMSAGLATERFGVMFGMTMPLLSFPIAFIASLTSIILPEISERSADKNLSEMRRKSAKAIHSTSLLAMPITALMIPLGKPLCALLYKNELAGEFLVPLALSFLISYYELTLGALLNGIGKQKESAAYIVAGGIVSLIFTWLAGTPKLGMRAFVAGSVLSGAICAALQFICLLREIKLVPQFRNWFFTPFLASALAGLITNLALYFSQSIAASAALGAISYFLALRALGTSFLKYVKTLKKRN